jgi:hypothetical protein
MRDLRRRCEWDRAQTHESLRPYLVEEAYEVDDAIRAATAADARPRGRRPAPRRAGRPATAGALPRRGGRGARRVRSARRGGRASSPRCATATRTCTRPPARTRRRAPRLGADEGAPAARDRRGAPRRLPALHRAHRLQDRAAGVGFDWPDAAGPADKVARSWARCGRARAPVARRRRARGRTRDLLFAAVTCAARPACTRRSPWTRRTPSSPRAFGASSAWPPSAGLDRARGGARGARRRSGTRWKARGG